MSTRPQHYVAEVRAQYEDLPYPYVDVAREREQLGAADSYSLDALNHFGWGGLRDLRDGARFLVAGEGTGDTVVYFAEQLRGTNAEIVALDLSQASIAIAQARLKKRGLTNVTHHHMSLLDLPTANLGMFDVIECGGVLHHLADPDAGLQALTSVLTEDGLMAIMVYGQYGRMAVYMIQDLLRQLIPADAPRDEKIAIARSYLNAMPRSHWFSGHNERFIHDIQWPDGSGIFDLFLHSHDRAYTVPQIYDWLAQAGLQLTSFFDEQVNDLAYLPELYTQDIKLMALLRDRSVRDRQTLAELMHGNMNKHYFYAAKQPKPITSYEDTMVLVWAPVFRSQHPNWVAEMQVSLQAAVSGQRVHAASEQRYGMPPMQMTKQSCTAALLARIDGVTPIGHLIERVAAECNEPLVQVRAQFSLLYRELFNNKRVFLRHPSITPYIGVADIQKRLAAIPEIV